MILELFNFAKNYKPILKSNRVKRYADNNEFKHKNYLYWSMYNCEFSESK